jgi:hypothetical protein
VSLLLLPLPLLVFVLVVLKITRVLHVKVDTCLDLVLLAQVIAQIFTANDSLATMFADMVNVEGLNMSGQIGAVSRHIATPEIVKNVKLKIVRVQSRTECRPWNVREQRRGAVR